MQNQEKRERRSAPVPGARSNVVNREKRSQQGFHQQQLPPDAERRSRQRAPAARPQPPATGHTRPRGKAQTKPPRRRPEAGRHTVPSSNYGKQGGRGQQQTSPPSPAKTYRDTYNQAPYNRPYEEDFYSDRYYYEDAYDDRAYRSPRNTLGGDPYDHLQRPAPWLKWVTPILAGTVFVACVIILIILLSKR